MTVDEAVHDAEIDVGATAMGSELAAQSAEGAGLDPEGLAEQMTALGREHGFPTGTSPGLRAALRASTGPLDPLVGVSLHE
ncbi:MAG: hypothetical protein EOO75_17085 [Myxococcales bacterium]|nr:MAG: hypothetical protein EOO75_17085 [Myxococcales bacterium]